MKHLSRYFLKEDTQIVMKYMKRCLTSLYTRETKTKITMRYYQNVIRIAQILKTDNIECWPGCGTTGTRTGEE